MHRPKIITAIDIGTSKITTIVAQYFETEQKTNIIAVASTPATGFRKGQIVNLEDAAQTITQSVESAERMAGLSLPKAYISVTAPHIESLNSRGVVSVSNPNGEIAPIDIARVTEAAQTVTLPVGKEIIHCIPRVYSVDGQEGILDPLGMNGNRLELEAHLIVASSPAIKNLGKCFDSVGIKVISQIYSGLATAQASLTPTEKELGVALVDIGGSITNISVFTENSPAFSTVIPVGANNITNDLAIGLRLSLDDAQKLKIHLSLSPPSPQFQDEFDLSSLGETSATNQKVSLQTALNGIIKPRLEEIFTLVYQQITLSGLANSIPNGMILTGGGALTCGVKDVCSKIIPLPVRIAYPPKISGVVDEILSPAYTSAIGLILYALDHSSVPHLSSLAAKSSFSGLFDKIKNLLEPLLP
jgi:cell division protein FtsA